MLFGSKFTKKYKHYLSNIMARLDPIRKKKEAVVWYLKNDVAALLSHGYDLIAFSRINEIICEMNQESCYNMIHQYCGDMLKHLKVLQKQRECPDEAKELISTLIFAAARFPQLPELCKLRHIFTQKFGGHMESFVNSDFMKNTQEKEFSCERKIQVMQSIALEFSIGFDSDALMSKLNNYTIESKPTPEIGAEPKEAEGEPKVICDEPKELQAESNVISDESKAKEAPHSFKGEKPALSSVKFFAQNEHNSQGPVQVKDNGSDFGKYTDENITDSDQCLVGKQHIRTVKEDKPIRLYNAAPPYVKPEEPRPLSVSVRSKVQKKTFSVRSGVVRQSMVNHVHREPAKGGPLAGSLVQAVSLQPNMFSPNRARVHPNLPSFDELVTRVKALTKP